MYALTIRDVDALTYAKINSIASDEGLSLSQVLKRLVEHALEIYPRKSVNDFSRFAGRWSATEAAQFDASTARVVDEEDWK